MNKKLFMARDIIKLDHTELRDRFVLKKNV